jgi:hypothetical protein
MLLPCFVPTILLAPIPSPVICMIASEIERITRVVQAVEPRARLVPQRLLRRVIRRHFDLSAGAKAPHDFVFELPGELVRELLGDADFDTSTPSIILLPLPKDDEPVSADEFLLGCWRNLFHAAIDRSVPGGNSGFADDRRLFNATVLHEIRVVLESERRLPPPADESILFREFAALFLELHYFAPHLVGTFFPGFTHPEAVVRFLEARVHAAALFDATRPAGTPDPRPASEHPVTSVGETLRASLPMPRPGEVEQLRSKALRATGKGNDVRAAICFRQLNETDVADERLRSLVKRLRGVLDWSESTAQEWFAALQPILDHAALHGFWDVGERLLYELQKACLDIERKSYSVDAVEWFVSFGKQPVMRLLNKPRRVNVLRRLRAALRHLDRLAIPEMAKQRLEHLLLHAIHASEKRVCDENRPILNEVLDEVGIVAENQAERISRAKMVEELLDTLCARGFLKMSDLRDALARSRVKLNDLSGPKELILGDPIIRANRKLALRMDGIYHRGEIYMRALQRLSSLGFGTKVGRLLVLWFILPFLASFVVVFFVDELAHLLGGLFHWLAGILLGAESKAAQEHTENIKPWDPLVISFGVVLLILIHAPRVRRVVGIWARRLVVDLPSIVYHSPIVRGIFHNAATRFFTRYLLLPLLVGLALIFLMRSLEYDWEATLLVGCGSALLTGTFFRTSFGRGLEERLDESLARLWRIVSVNFIIGVLTLFLQFFRWLFEWMERGMYAVDEWLRFKEGQSRTTLVFKIVFGLFWFVFTYLFRFAWNLLIEPQINPIKHFPVVTVSHKLILPLAFSTDFHNKAAPLASLLMGPFDITVKTANTVASSIVWGIPGIFGFLVWELKENWRLYRANRSPVIGAVPVGSHGERVRGLLRPGLHSGVVPKTYAKLRKAESAGNHKKAAKHHHRLEHVAEAIEHLVERELIAYLKSSQRWGGLPIHVERIALATNRLRVFLTIHHWEGGLVISIEERGGWLIGSLEETGWLDRLNDKQRAAFVDTLAELYKLCGVHVLREQAAAVFGVEPLRVDCRPEGLLILPQASGLPVAIDYTDDPQMIPNRPVDGRAIGEWSKGDLVLSDCRLEWLSWVERWELDQAEKAPDENLLGHYRVTST